MFNIQIVLLALFSFFGSLKANAQDWANLAKYKEANAQWEKISEDSMRVVFMGNSITEHWKKHNPSFFENNPYINRGISGQTTPQMLLRFRQDVINLKPKVVVILAGTNDIAGNTGPMTVEQIRDNILSMVELAESNGICPIVSAVLPAYDYPWRPGKQPNVLIPKLNRLLQKMTEDKDIIYLDYFSAMTDDKNGLPKDLAKDGVHPTKKGYGIMEVLVEKAIQKAMNKTK